MTGHEGSPAGMGTDIPRRSAGVSRIYIHLFRLDPQGFGDCRDQNRMQALPHFHPAVKNIHIAEVIQLQNHAAAVGTVYPAPAAYMKQGCHPLAASFMAIVLLIGFIAPVKFFRYTLQTFPEAAGIDLHSHGSGFAWEIAVDFAQFQGVDTGCLSQLVHIAFQSPVHFRIAVAPHGLTVGVIGIDQLRVKPDVFHPVKRCGREHHHRRESGSPGGIGSVVLENLDFSKGQYSVRITTLSDLSLR